MTYRELVYIVLDLSKLSSDDMTINEEHVMFLLDKVRAALLWQKYKSQKLEVPESNYQTLCLDLTQDSANSAAAQSMGACVNGGYIRTSIKVPTLLEIGNTVVYPTDYYQGLNICFIARERMRYVGKNEILRNIIYCSIGPDNYLYFKSSNPQFKYLRSVQFTGVFENASAAAALVCDKECDSWDREFAIEESLAQMLIDTLVKEIVGAAWRPSDDANTANDELANLASYIRQNAKSNLRKQIEA